MYYIYIHSKKTTNFGAPYHFRACAKMVWGRSFSATQQKNPRFLGGSWGAARLFE